MDRASPHCVFVALGSNLGDREQHLKEACSQIALLAECERFRCSSVYETDPMGPQDQPDYLNAVCQFTYAGTARQLLEELQNIERAHGRVKATTRWTARPLDLDIVVFGDQRIDEFDLQIPHIGLAERSFVIWPLIELQPDLNIPGLGPVELLAKKCQKFGITRYKGAAKYY